MQRKDLEIDLLKFSPTWGGENKSSKVMLPLHAMAVPYGTQVSSPKRSSVFTATAHVLGTLPNRHVFKDFKCHLSLKICPRKILYFFHFTDEVRGSERLNDLKVKKSYMLVEGFKRFQSLDSHTCALLGPFLYTADEKYVITTSQL